MDFAEYITSQVVIIAVVITFAIVFGILLQKIILRLRKRSARNRSVNLRIFLNSIQGPIRLWVILGAFYGLGKYFQVEADSVLGILVTGSLVVIIITFVRVLYQVVQTTIQYYVRRGRLPNTTIFNSLSAILMVIIGIALVLQAMDISITPIIAAFGIGGLAVALALQPTLSNLFAGIAIIASKQINPGDYVELNNNQSGYIEDIQWRTTSIRTVQNNLIIIPNSIVSNMIVINYSLPADELSIPIPVGVHYDSDLDHVRDVCWEVAKDIQMNEEGAVRDFDPVIRFRQFGPSSIDLNVILRIREFTAQHQIRSEFIRKLRKRFQQEGIIIPYPITTVEFANKLPTEEGSEGFS